MISPNREGVSMDDFANGRDMTRTIMNKNVFTDLAGKAMDRMRKYKPETQKKIREYMMAEDENPALFKEFMAEFKATWDKCDADKDGKLNNAEFKNFANCHNENMKKRWGESTKGNE